MLTASGESSRVILTIAIISGAVWLPTGLPWPLVACYALLLASASAVQTEASNLAASVADVAPALVISVLLAAYGLAAWPRRQESGERTGSRYSRRTVRPAALAALLAPSS